MPLCSLHAKKQMSTKLGTERQKTLNAEGKRRRKEEGEKEKIKTGVCAVCAYFGVYSEAVDKAASICARTRALCLFPNMCVQWKVNGSPVYTFLKNQPWCHHEPILNPPLSKSITPALPPSRCLFFCSTSPSFTLRSCLLDSSPIAPPFSYFRILQNSLLL